MFSNFQLIDDLHKAAKSGDVDGVTNYDEDEVDIDAANSVSFEF